jgi:gas vesicle protein
MVRRHGGSGNGLLIAGILLGAAIGAAVALYYTPGTGAENRRRLTQWATARKNQLLGA